MKIVCIGSYTKDAAQFAQGEPIELVGGELLLEMIQATPRDGVAGASLSSRIEPALAPAIDTTAPTRTCRQCGSAVVQRINRRKSEAFLGCSQFPQCRGTG